MKRTRKERGITLVALIITIILLLILAIVSIRAVTGDGIIQYAKNAKSEYELAQENEVKILNEYINYLDFDFSEVDLIQFTIDGTTYYAEEGMEWGDWVDSEYNTIGAYVDDDNLAICIRECQSCLRRHGRCPRWRKCRKWICL